MRERATRAFQMNLALALVFILVAQHSHAQSAVETTSADFYVAPNGRDAWSGRISQPKTDLSDGPFATLGRARDAVRELKKRSARKELVVRIRGGVYRLQETLVFSLADSAPAGGTITYAAYPQEMPIFRSDVPIRSWRRLREYPPNLPAAAPSAPKAPASSTPPAKNPGSK